ncbi:MAG: RNA polymerase sigma factor [Acidimicrobiia bacterium]
MAASQAQEAHFRSLFGSHREAIQSYCFRRLPDSDANDAAAEVFLVAWRHISVAPVGDGELPWLYAIARNVVRNASRSARRSGRLRVRLAGLSQRHDAGPEVITVRNMEESEVLEALARLRPEDQEIIRLRTWEELPVREISSILGLSVRAVESRLTRSRRKLKQMLEAPSTRPTAIQPVQTDNGGAQ